MYGERANSNSAQEICPSRLAGRSPVADRSSEAPAPGTTGSAIAEVKALSSSTAGGCRGGYETPRRDELLPEVELQPQPVLSGRRGVVKRRVVLDSGDVLLVCDV